MSGGDETRRLVGDVQRFGLLSAAAVVDRFTAMIDEAVAGGSGRSQPPSADAGRFMADSARLVEAYLRFLDSASGLIVGRSDGAAAPDRVGLSAAPGTVAEATAWIHNTSAEAGVDITFHPSPLVGPRGVEIRSDRIKVKPKRIDRLAAGDSVELRIRVEVPAKAAVGGYHGVILTSTPPAATIAVQLEVVP